jgi:[histone H3]-lysine36 N-dimethyltransferase SETMAR
MEKSKLRTVLEYEFRCGTKAADAVRNVNRVFGEGSTNKMTVGRWYTKFSKGDFNLTNEPRGKPEPKVNNDDLLAAVESDPSQTAAELAQMFKVSKSTILEHLHAIHKVKKLDKWVPRDLSNSNKMQRIQVCISLLTRHKNESFIHRIVTCDEKWITWDNRKRSSQWLDKNEPPRQFPKPSVHQKKVMVTVWWSTKGVIHYNFLKPGTTITADVYCKELDYMMQKLVIKHPKIINRCHPLLLHDNAKPHTARITALKLAELKLEVLPHPAYSPDLAPTDFHFFRNLNNFLLGKKFDSQEGVENAFRCFVDSCSPSFYNSGFEQLPLKWQKCIDNMGNYFD